MDKRIIEFNRELRGEAKMDFQAGDVVKVHSIIKEGKKERIQIFEGLIIAVKGRQSSSPTITVRKVSHNVGVEMIFPVLSKNIKEIELIKKAKVRRAKLYYVRGLTAKQSRMQYKDVNKVKKIEKKSKKQKAEKEVNKVVKEEEKKETKQVVKEEKKEEKKTTEKK